MWYWRYWSRGIGHCMGKNLLCVRHLDLSNNQISDEGAATFGRALASDSNTEKLTGRVETLDLSNNKDIGDSGAKAIAGALEKGTLTNLILCSCHIHTDGAACFSKSLRAIGRQRSATSTTDRPAFPFALI
jgi:hypothetical protein